MALKAQSQFLFGLQITTANRYINFKISGGGTQLTAIIPLGYYTLLTLLGAIKTAMQLVDTANTYTLTADRTLSAGTQNRVTISTNGAFLSLLFATGANAPGTPAILLGFTATDKTGAATYTGTSSAGTILISTDAGFNYLSEDRDKKTLGSLNLSANGLKETVVFQIQRFFQAEYKYEPSTNLTLWSLFLLWAIQQRPFDFTPEISSPTVFYPVTLDKTAQDGSGMAYNLTEMIPDFPFLYMTGALTFRIIES